MKIRLLFSILMALAVLFALATVASAATYYVDGDGNIVDESSENIAYQYTLSDSDSSMQSMFVYDINETKIVLPDMPSYTKTLKPGDWNKPFNVYHIDDTEKTTDLASQIKEIELHENIYLDGAYSVGAFSGYSALEKISFYGTISAASKGGFFEGAALKEVNFYGQGIAIPSVVINELNPNLAVTVIFHEGSSGTLSTGGHTLPTFAKLADWKIIINPDIKPSNPDDTRLGTSWGTLTGTTGWELIVAIPSKATYTQKQLEDMATSHGFCSRFNTLDAATVKEASVKTWCELGYEEHSGEEKLVFDNEKGYFADINIVTACTKCLNEEIGGTIGAIFTYFGYSYTEKAVGGTYSMAQFFSVNEENLAKYEELMGTTLTFGVIAQANKLEDGQETVSTIKPTIGVDKVLYKDFTNDAHNYFEIKIAGIDADNLDTKIAFCAYVIEDGKMSYLNNGETVEELTGESYNDVVAIKSAE